MKAFIITVEGLPLSEKQAAACVVSGNSVGEYPEIFKAINRFESVDVLNQLDIKLAYHTEIVERKTERHQISTSEIGCALSHYKLYNKCIELNEVILILEHDALFNTSIPDFPVDEVVNVAFTANATNQVASVSGLYEYKYNDMRSAAGYCISPKGARKLIDRVHSVGLACADTFITKDYINLQEYIPYPIEQTSGISSIQVNHNMEQTWQEYTK